MSPGQRAPRPPGLWAGLKARACRRIPGPASLRLTLAVAGAIIALSLAAMVVQYRLTERSLLARQAELLQSDISAFAAHYEQRRIPALREAMEFRAVGSDPAEAVFLLLDRQGTRLAGNLAEWPPALRPPPEGGFDRAGLAEFTLDQDGTRLSYQGVVLTLPGGFPVLVARGTGSVGQTLAGLRQLILLVAGGMGLVALALGWVVSQRVMGRIRRLNDLADRVAAGDLAARLPGPRARDEFGALETHMHQMLDRIQALNRATHRLSDSIAHELRTPLNRLSQKLAGLQGQDAFVAGIQSEMRQAIRVFDSLLDISAAEAQSGSLSGFLPVSLSEVAGEVFELYEPVGEEQSLRMQLDLAPGLMVLGDRNLIAQLLSNLLDNAIKFTPAGGSVTLALMAAGPQHLLEVRDTGPGLPEGQEDIVFERFTRSRETDHIQGHGLGLALVKAIATRHGAKAELISTRPGLTARLTWPALTESKPG